MEQIDEKFKDFLQFLAALDSVLQGIGNDPACSEQERQQAKLYARACSEDNSTMFAGLSQNATRFPRGVVDKMTKYWFSPGRLIEADFATSRFARQLTAAQDGIATLAVEIQKLLRQETL